MNKVLIISPTPTHPQSAGNRSRILALCDYIKMRGHDLDFFYIRQENVDEEAMINYFGASNYFEINLNNQSNSESKNKNILSRFIKKINFIKNIIFDNFKKGDIDLSKKYNRDVDYYYDNNIDIFIKKKLLNNKYTHVIIEYVVFSKALEIFDNSVVKIIDTHDVLSNRYRIFLGQKSAPQWYSLFPKEEAKGLNRADIILSIQNKEKKYFESISKAKVVILGHQASVSILESELHNDILFVGSDNNINIDGINHFIEFIFPKIVEKLNNVKLIIAGNIIKRRLAIMEHPNIEFYGEYNTNSEVYSLASVVVVPINYGTGLKIKTIEALSCGKAIVTFKEGISGLEEPNVNNNYCLLAKDDLDFSNKVLSILRDFKLKMVIKDSAIRFIKKYNVSIVDVLDEIFESNHIVTK